MEIFKKIKEMRWTAKFLAALNKEDRANVLKAFNKRKEYYTPKILDFNADLKSLQKCALCPDLCGFDAPCLLLSKDTSLSPQNKSRVGYFTGMDLLPLENSSVISTFYSCMNCDACKHWCPMDISAGDLMIQMRFELEKRNLIPDQVHHLKSRLDKNGSIFEESPFSVDSEFNIDMKNAKVFYYIGCMSAEHRKPMVRANIAILKYLGIPFTTKMEHRVCCGSPLYKVGYKNVAKANADKNISTIKSSNTKLVVTDCPACLQMLETTYTEWEKNLKVKILHIQDFILEQIKNDKLKMLNSKNTTVTYHDPCILARKMEDTLTPRKILDSIPDITVKEAYLHGEGTRCCGYGGGYHLTNPNLSNKEGNIRLEQLQKHNPDYIVSSCPTCEYAFTQARKNSPSTQGKGEIKDISELVAMALNLKY
jgi:fumarate reductase (CoM/CoB) subunit B